MSISALQFPTFKPAMRIITNITNDNPAIITTSFDNSYITGTIVRITVPFQDGYYPWGMREINNQKGKITVINTTQFSINIDTTNYEPFRIPIVPPNDVIRFTTQLPQVVPFGEDNSILTAAITNVL
jgi:hypothetical protein